RPLHQTRSMPDVLLAIGQRLERPLSLPWNAYEEMLKSTFAGLSRKEDAWEDIHARGGWWREVSTQPAREPSTPPRRMPVVEAQFDGGPDEFPLHFLPYASQAFLDGSLAHLPWLQELPDVISTAMWSTWLELNPTTAGRLGIAEGDAVEIRSAHGTVRAPAVLSPGIAPDVVAMPVGQGHKTYTRYASGRGANPLSILSGLTEPETGALAWAATRVRIAKLENADPTDRLILFSGGMKEHDESHR
ncbi:MAG TPA: molybdopterin dinucleotide binding domain-containing protein, partial [Terriglobia bacterium]|nr:molybdopterin dinucleotide binding domain-containing protein [Terriglobia bacterium]